MKLIRPSLLIIVLLALGVGAVLWMMQPEPVGVRVAKVERGLVERSISNTRAGTIMACQRARLAPSSGGQIAAIHARKGDRVMQGELLIELWNQDIKAERELAEQQLSASASSANAACLTADEARRDADRLARLHQQGVASEEQRDQANTQALARQAECQAAGAEIGVAKAKLGLALAHLQRTQLRAPFEGVVAELNGEVNEYVTPSPPGILTLPVVDLLDDSCFYVSAPIDEVDAAGIEVGMPVRISLDAFVDKEFSGQVRRIARYVLDLEKQARTVEVEALFCDPGDMQGLLAGYSADLEIILDSHSAALRIPSEALMNGKRVLLFDPAAQTLSERHIEIGLANWKHTEVTAGLGEGDLLVLSIDKEGVEAGVRARIESGDGRD